MYIKTVILASILFLTISAFSCSYASPRPEGEFSIEEVELLKYEAIDFEKLLAKPEAVPIPTDRDPFRSSLENLELLDIAAENQLPMLGAESLRLTGIIKGPNGPVALIKPGPKEKTYAVKANSMLGKFRIEKIADNKVILNINGARTVLKLGGGENDYE